MKKIYFSLLGALLFVFLATTSIAQPSYCLRLVQGTVTATTIEVDIQIQFSSTSGLGSSNLQILYDNTRLSAPVLGTDNIPGPFYSASTVTSPTTSKASYNIELLVPNFGITVETAPMWTSVGTIIFTYTGATPTTLTWSYTGTTTETVVFDHNESDQIFATSATASCLQAVTLFSTLPIELSEFKAQWTNDLQREAVLNWTTLSETNNEKFEIQRSFDGFAWRTIGEVPGSGNSFDPIGYSFVDETVGSEIPGEFVYYKIAQVDLSGQRSNSEIRSLHKTSQVEDLTIFPNPFTDDISLIVPKDFLTVNDGLLSVEDISGRTLHIQGISPAANDQVVHFDGSHLIPGVYIFKIETGSGVYSHKVIKQ